MRLLIFLFLIPFKTAYTQSTTTDSAKAVFNYVVGLYDSCDAKSKELSGALKYSDYIIDRQQTLLESEQKQTTKLEIAIGTYRSDSTKMEGIIAKTEQEVVIERANGKLKGVGYGVGGTVLGGGIGAFFVWLGSLLKKEK